MNWPSKRPVRLAVTRFLPEVAPAVEPPKPVAGLSPLARALWRDKREKECAKVEPTIPLTDMGSEDDSSDEPDDYREYGDWQDDYADAVGISRHKEL